MLRRTVPAALTLVACVLGAPTTLADDGVDGHGPVGAMQAAQPSVPTLSEQFGMEFIPAPAHLLVPQDNEFFLTEDVILGNGNGPNALRFAVPTPTGLSLASGEWIDVEGGRLWRTVVSSSNATTARLHLTGIDLPAGQQMRLSSPGWADSVIGPIEGKGEFGNGEMWSLALPPTRCWSSGSCPPARPPRRCRSQTPSTTTATARSGSSMTAAAMADSRSAPATSTRSASPPGPGSPTAPCA
jgi:hypothetical protein